MKFDIERSALVSVLGKAIGATDPSPSVPALSCVALEATKGEIRASGTNLYMVASSVANATVEVNGVAHVNARDLLSRVKAMPEGVLSVEADNAKEFKMTIRSGSRKFTLPLIPSGDYPPLPNLDSDDRHRIPCSTLLDVLQSTRFSSYSGEDRVNMHCTRIEIGGGAVRGVATDGISIATRGVDVEDSGVGEYEAPYAMVGELLKSLDSVGDCFLSLSGVYLVVNHGMSTLAHKITGEDFPPYKAILPKVAELSCSCKRTDLLDAIKATALAGEKRVDKSNVRLVILRFKKGVIHLTASGSGDGEDVVACSYDGAKPVVTGFNADLLVNALGATRAESVELWFSEETLAPVVIQSEGYRCLALPVRL